MMEASRVASGMESGRMVAEPHPRNSMITQKLRPLPTSSSMYSHRNCITSMNTVMKNVITNGPRKDLSMNRSSFFILQNSISVSLSY